jgi:hypothetical protein
LTLIEKSFFQEVEVIIKEISTNNIAGDIVFVGVFKGGAALYLQALFEHYGCKRKVWLFDSFKGFNREQITHEEDKKALELFGTDEYFKELVSVDQISKLFKRFDLFENTVLIEGFIEDTLKQQQITSIAFLH